jgi:hypothetical protein
VQKNIRAKSLYAALGMAFAATAWAEAPTQDMTVAGTIKAPTCEVDIGGGEGGGTINHGDISPTLIKAGTTFHELEPVTLDWTISCDAQTYLTYSVSDIENDSVSMRAPIPEGSFGLGFINTSGRLGYYTMRNRNLTVDGDPAYHGLARAGLSLTSLDTRTSSRHDYSFHVDGWRSGWGVTAESASSALKSGEVFTMQMEVRTYLSGAADINGGVIDAVPLAGHAMFSFAFGL